MYDSRFIDKAFRNQAIIHRHMHKTGCTLAGQPLWTDQENAELLKHYPNYEHLSGVLIRRTKRAMQERARKLGLVKPRRVWSLTEEEKMPPPYKGGAPMSEIIQSLDNKNKQQVYSKANHLGVRRPRRRPRPTGMPIVDMIRDRNFDNGDSPADLNVWTNRKTYWTRPRKYDWKAISHALRILGGRIVPIWPD
ncbi:MULTISPECIES: hypothetical protein [Asticcacaulis]|uniref:hypothetical protein n=1 Tax=Asticcacaulis TaxID=76890 RepID=UPI001AE69515|nr:MULTISPECIES: hypothetical protein [Asticcacaulis]MBP2159570.1 hypothetical protein [Asticcacaulis solisilvae]MDR6800603.1 hypothetical protein [Asticcacaulis sp. BE141]